MPTAILYAVDLDDMRRWVGLGDKRELAAAREALGEAAEDEEWTDEAMQIVDRLLPRLVMEGKLYEDLKPEERYCLTQLLIDLFDNFAEPEAVSEEIPLEALRSTLEPVWTRGGKAARWLVHGRALNTDEVLWPVGEDVEEFVPFLGYVTRQELPDLIRAIEQVGGPGRGRPSGIARALLSGARSALDSERDLVSMVG